MKNLTLILLALFIPLFSYAEPLFLRNQLKQAQKGDYLVTVRNKNYTLLLIEDKNDRHLKIQEVTIPEQRFPSYLSNWREWLESGAPNHTAWITYDIDLNMGTMGSMYSYTLQQWLQVSETDNIFTKLINLPFSPMPARERRYVGTSDGRRRLWHPRMVVEGQVIPGVAFDAWTGRWPHDQSPLSGKTVQIYLPQEGQPYASYFPYWMSVRGTVGKTHLRIVDSGRGLKSPLP